MVENRLSRSLRATFIGMAVNAVLAVGKLAAGIIGGSYALVADAVESLADVFSSIIVWRGVVVAAEPPDADHPYGHGKAEPIAAALVSGLLLMAAIGIAVQATREIMQPHHAPKPFTLLVLVATVVIKEMLFRYVVREGAELESTVMQSDAWHHRSDAITSLAAAIGIGIALIGRPGFEIADSIAAIIAAGIIAFNGTRLLRTSIRELMDTAPSRTINSEVHDIASRIPGVDAVEKCIVRKMGFQYFVDMHVEVDPQMTVQQAHDIAHQVKDRVREQLPKIRDVLVHIEPSGRYPDRDSGVYS